MAHSMASILTDAEVEQLLGEFSMDTAGTKRSRQKTSLKQGLLDTSVQIWLGQLEAAHQPNWWTWTKGQAVAFDFHK